MENPLLAAVEPTKKRRRQDGMFVLFFAGFLLFFSVFSQLVDPTRPGATVIYGLTAAGLGRMAYQRFRGVGARMHVHELHIRCGLRNYTYRRGDIDYFTGRTGDRAHVLRIHFTDGKSTKHSIPDPEYANGFGSLVDDLNAWADGELFQDEIRITPQDAVRPTVQDDVDSAT